VNPPRRRMRTQVQFKAVFMEDLLLMRLRGGSMRDAPLNVAFIAGARNG
jgi:hypothetical protein